LWISIHVRVYSSTRYVVQLNLPVRPEGLQVTKGSAGSLLLGSILKGHLLRASCTPCGRLRPPATEQSWAVVPGMYGTHYKHCSLIPPLVSNNKLALLRCGYMCAGTLVHISRHLGRTSNYNKRCQTYIRCMFFNSGHMDLVYDNVRYIVYR